MGMFEKASELINEAAAGDADQFVTDTLTAIRKGEVTLFFIRDQIGRRLSNIPDPADTTRQNLLKSLNALNDELARQAGNGSTKKTYQNSQALEKEYADIGAVPPKPDTYDRSGMNIDALPDDAPPEEEA